MIPNSAAPSPLSGKRAAQAHPARATYLINHVKFMVPLEGRPSIPIENVGSSKQNGRSCAGNNERRSQTTRSPDHETWRGQRKILHSTKLRPIISDHIDRPDSINHSNCTHYRPNSLWAPSHTSPHGHKTINNISSKMPAAKAKF